MREFQRKCSHCGLLTRFLADKNPEAPVINLDDALQVEISGCFVQQHV
jgi:glutaredoxin